MSGWKQTTKEKKRLEGTKLISILEAFRERNRLKKKEMCSVLDLSVHTYTNISSGRTLPTSTTLNKLKEAVNNSKALEMSGAEVKKDGKILKILAREPDVPPIPQGEPKIKMAPDEERIEDHVIECRDCKSRVDLGKLAIDWKFDPSICAVCKSRNTVETYSKVKVYKYRVDHGEARGLK